MGPQRIRLSRSKGFNLQAYSRSINGLDAVKVDRSTKWGSRFYVSKKLKYGCIEPIPGKGAFFCCRDIEHVIDTYRYYLRDGKEILGLRPEDIEELRGKNLACWCPLPKDGEPDLCHAAVLLEYLNR